MKDMINRTVSVIKSHKKEIAIAGGLIAVALLSGKRRIPDQVILTPPKKWSYAAQKMQYLLDVCALGFGGQGTIYMNNSAEWSNEKQALLIDDYDSKRGTLDRDVKYIIGFTCSRLVNTVCWYWGNFGNKWENGAAYSCKWVYESSFYGTLQTASQSDGGYSKMIYGVKEYADFIVQTESYKDLYDMYDRAGQITITHRVSGGSGHCWIMLKIDDDFRLVDPYTRKPYPDGFVRFAADGGKTSAKKTVIEFIEPDRKDIKDKHGKHYIMKFVTLKGFDNDDSCAPISGPCKGSKPVPLLFRHMHW